MEFVKLMTSAIQKDTGDERTDSGVQAPVQISRTISEARDPSPISLDAAMGADAQKAGDDAFTFDGAKRIRKFSASPPRDSVRLSGPREESGEEEECPPKLQRT